MIIPQEKPQDMYIYFLTKILETLTEFRQLFFSQNPETFVQRNFFPKCMPFLKKILLTTRMQV